MKYKLVIFDMDGTILDTLEDLADTANWALTQSKLPVRTIEEIRMFVGNGIRKLISRAVPSGTDEALADQVYADFISHYRDHCAIKTRPYTGIPELLEKLRKSGIRTAVVSNKADFGVQSLCKQYFPGAFDAAVGERQGIAKKPAPDSVNAVLELLNIRRNDAVYVGDSDVDVETAANAHMDCIGVSWGFRGRKFLEAHSCKIIADQVTELEHMLLR